MADKKVLGVDFDDVLIRTGDALAAFHNTTYGTNYLRDEVKDFEMSETWDCTPEEAERRIAEFVTTEFHRDAEAVFGAYNALQALSDTYEVVIVTARPLDWRDATMEWLEKNLIGLYKEVHFAGHTEPGKKKKKSEIGKELQLSAFIDDAIHFASDMATLDIPVFLFDTPWNRKETPPGVTRVHSWDEIMKALVPPQ